MVNSQNMRLYVHIPFCLKKCDYCDFFSLPSATISDDYVKALVKEASFYAKAYSIPAWKTLYVGGGTPSLLNADQMEFLIEGIKSACPQGIEGEACFELNPESVSEEKLLTLSKCGINRISLGVQSFSDKSLKAINRHASLEATLNGLEKVKSLWRGQLNLDLIAGLPLQTEEEFLLGIDKALSFNAHHISLYSLMVEEGTPLYEKIENGMEWDSDEADRLWLLGRDYLEKKGFKQYEVSNFAKGRQFYSHHNLAYWQQKNYLGLGSGATSTNYNFFTSEEPSALRWTNSLDIKKYTDFFLNFNLSSMTKEDCLYLLKKDESSENSIPRQKEFLSLSTLEEEFFMLGFRTCEGVNSLDYKKKYSKLGPYFGDIEKRLGVDKKDGLFTKWEKEGKIVRKKNADETKSYFLNKDGLLFLNSFLLELFD